MNENWSNIIKFVVVAFAVGQVISWLMTPMQMLIETSKVSENALIQVAMMRADLYKRMSDLENTVNEQLLLEESSAHCLPRTSTRIVPNSGY